ncbi:MAG: type II toxin-antitoxin system VapC family toxin [Staphylothermus sp.]|nr:type II toxin-antitoxin system VapC family toxin [Staphylothermus sp.]
MKIFIDAPLLIYLNTVTDPRDRYIYENYYLELLSKYKAYTDVLVLDELINVSKKKYGVPYELSIEFIESIVLPYINVLELSEEEYKYASKLIVEYKLKPSDSLHVGAMLNNNIDLIVSEDKEYDKIRQIKRIWIH